MGVSMGGPAFRDMTVDNRDYGPVVLGCCVTMTALAIVTMAARIYARGWLTHSIDADDYTIWVSMTFSALGLGIIVPEVLSGAGRQGASLSPSGLRKSLMLQFLTQLVYVLSILFVKVSITFCLLRFAPSKIFAWFLRSCMIFFILTGLGYFIFLTLLCQPLSMIWDPSVKGSCISLNTVHAFAYANNSISLTVDLLLATLPIPMIWKVQVAMHIKVAIGFVMGLGALAAAACAIKVHYLSPILMTGDVLFDSINWTIWTVVECNIAITAASVPSILPLIKHIHGKIKSRKIKTPPSPGIVEDEQTLPHVPSGDPTERRTLSMQQALMNDGKKELAKKEKGEKPAAEVGDVSEDEMDEEDISHMYAAASRKIAKNAPPSRQDQLRPMRKLSGL